MKEWGMTPLFKNKSPEQVKSIRLEVRLTASENEKIRKAADVRNMAVSEFVRRAALGRRADVQYQTGIVLALIDVTRSMRALHAAVVARGILPPEEEWLPVILEARAAILRISK